MERVTDPGRLRALVQAVLLIGSDLSLPDVLRRIVQSACEVVDATYGALGVLNDSGEGLAQFITEGISPDQARLIGRFPEGKGIIGLLITDPRPIRLKNLAEHPMSAGFPEGHPVMRSFLGVPVISRDRVFGNLYLTEKHSAPEFSEEDEGLATALASAAGIAIENARLHSHVRDLALSEDRSRIAAELHDSVIQRLFAVGLALQGTVRSISSRQAAEKVQQAVADLDDTIREIRATIFSLQVAKRSEQGLRAEILALTREVSVGLGFEPQVRFEGPIDSLVDDTVAANALAVIREGLSNVVRHAHANHVQLSVAARLGHLLVQIIDDGKGPGDGHRDGGRGVHNLGQRATELGGSFRLQAAPQGTGTQLVWEVPLPDAASS